MLGNRKTNKPEIAIVILSPVDDASAKAMEIRLAPIVAAMAIQLSFLFFLIFITATRLQTRATKVVQMTKLSLARKLLELLVEEANSRQSKDWQAPEECL